MTEIQQRFKVNHGNILKWAKEYTGPKFHGMILDPPYHLTSITERFGKQGSAPAKHGTDGAFGRVSRGFMNQVWDGGDIAFQPETWAVLGEHLYPGAISMAFASTRGFHRMAVAIEGLVSLAPNELLEAADMLALARSTKDWSLVEEVELWLRGHLKITEAIRSAGFIIHPTIFCWSFGSGFPKATRIDTTIDERAFQDWLQTQPEHKAELDAMRAEQREFKREIGTINKPLEQAIEKYITELKTLGGFLNITGTKKQSGAKFKQTQALIDNGGFNDPDRTEYELAVAATPLAREWTGHRYGGQALKPALEPIIVFQKPYDKDPVSSMVETGAGAWNIDAGRIGRVENDRFEYGVDGDEKQTTGDYGIYGKFNKVLPYEPHANGRWPSNLILSHSPECVQVGTKRVKSAKGQADYTVTGIQTPVSITRNVKTGAHHGDSTGHETVADWQCDESCPVYRLGLQSGSVSYGGNRDGTVSTPNAGSWKNKSASIARKDYDDTGTAARFFFNADYTLDRIEAADPLVYVPKASSTERDAGLHQFEPITVSDGRDKPIDNAYQRGETSRRNPHATIKPLTLIKHLASLILPPAMYAPERRLLVPFSGVGSEMIGGLLAGWDYVEGIELEALHVEVADIRIPWWIAAAEVAMTTEPKEILARVDPEKPVDTTPQYTMFDLVNT